MNVNVDIEWELRTFTVTWGRGDSRFLLVNSELDKIIQMHDADRYGMPEGEPYHLPDIDYTDELLKAIKGFAEDADG